MKLFIAILFIILIPITQVLPCTTFVLKNKETLLFGRNLDWVSDNGLVVINKQNTKKTALVFPPEIPATWTSKYGSITFNQFGKEFPFGGINEKGLVIEIMRSEAEYPTPDKRPALNELQWIQYQLDNSASLEDVIKNDKYVRILAVKQELHFLVCDKNGNSAVLEFRNGKLNVFKGEDLPLPILANSYYPNDLEKYNENISCRFTTVAKSLNTYKSSQGNPVDYSFKILNDVALDGSWSIVYDIKNMEIHFKTSSYKTIRKIKVNDFNFDCTEPSQLYDLKSEDKAYVNSLFNNYSIEMNKRKLDDAIQTNRITLPDYVISQFYNLSESYECEEK